MTRFYTKKGDDGYTGLLGDRRVPKYDQQIETLGAFDEANAALALARSVGKAPETRSILMTVQKDLYLLMAEVAATPETAERFQKISADNVHWLEDRIDEVSLLVHIPDEFIVPGDSTAGAAIDLARAVVRRAERLLARLFHSKRVQNRELLHYVNRLSSLCFVLELLENQVDGKTHPTLAKE
jgi:cob(I)alamin adenosyltransferase